MQRRLRAAGCLLAGLAAAQCSVNPYTHRAQWVMISPSYESTLGATAYRRLLNDPDNRVRTDAAAVRPVRRVIARLIEAAHRSRFADLTRAFEWDVSIIEDPEQRNAIALPGGKLIVYTGLFPVAGNEAGLAAVLAHEIAHALARHSAEQITFDALHVTRDDIRLPFSRQHESEADYIGLLLTAMAGYDPREAVRVWQRMQSSGDQPPPEYLSTHPSHATRIQYLLRHLPEAWRHYERTSPSPVADLPLLADGG